MNKQERKKVKALQELKFANMLRRVNRKPIGGGWGGHTKTASQARRRYNKAVRRENNALIREALND